MKMVLWAPVVATAVGVLGIVLGVLGGLPLAAGALGCGYLAVSNALLGLALRRGGAVRFGRANAVTTVRSVLVGFVTAFVAASFLQQIPVSLLLALAIPALLLDAVDGWVARRTRSETRLGARYDMEVDAFLLLVLSVFVAQALGGWVLAIGMMRYVFVAAGWALPWLRAPLPPRYWRKVVTAAQGVALVAAASGLLPMPVAVAVVAAALLLLCESFGRDVLWLARRRGTSRPQE